MKHNTYIYIKKSLSCFCSSICPHHRGNLLPSECCFTCVLKSTKPVPLFLSVINLVTQLRSELFFYHHGDLVLWPGPPKSPMDIVTESQQGQKVFRHHSHLLYTGLSKRFVVTQLEPLAVHDEVLSVNDESLSDCPAVMRSNLSMMNSYLSVIRVGLPVSDESFTINNEVLPVCDEGLSPYDMVQWRLTCMWPVLNHDGALSV